MVAADRQLGVRRPWLPASELGSGEGSQEEDPRCPGTVGGGACTSRYAPFEQRRSSALGQAQRADDRRTARRAVAGRRCDVQHPDATAGRCGGAEEEGGRARRWPTEVGPELWCQRRRRSHILSY